MARPGAVYGGHFHEKAHTCSMAGAWGGERLGGAGGSNLPARAGSGKPTATATIGPVGMRGGAPRDHLITITIALDGGSGGDKHGDSTHVGRTARSCLGACLPALAPERFDVRELSSSRRAKAAGVAHVVVGVEASGISAGKPPRDAVERMRTALTDDGYAVSIRERRECTEGPCAAEATVDWNQPEHIPSGWFSTVICGRHDYRSCAKCKSIYLLTSTNAAGQAPSVHCEVCGAVLVEWGSSKIWDAQLVKSGENGR